jgi:flagellar biosynthetic protein FlhB
MVIGFIVYQSFAGKFQEAMELPLTSLEYGLWWFFKLVMEIVVKVLVIFFVLAIIDLIWKKHQYQENLMMTKQEVKDENKMKEGDPKVKAKIRGKMRELITNSIVSNVQQSDVIVTNPVHVAVALKYSSDDAAPTIMAKGLRKRALYIKKLGRDAKIPVVESPALARSLYRHTKVGGFIPEQFFTAVAAILAELQRTGKRNFMRKSDQDAA